MGVSDSILVTGMMAICFTNFGAIEIAQNSQVVNQAEIVGTLWGSDTVTQWLTKRIISLMVRGSSPVGDNEKC